MGKKRLRPWAEDRINRNLFPGFMWMDKEKKIFRIPWKDKKSRSWCLSNAQIYKDWATVTGKHRQGDPENLSEWKAQLRNALRKVSDFVEMPNEHKLTGTDDPYKVYRIRASKSGANSDDTSGSTTSQINLMDSSYPKVDEIKFGDEAIEVEGRANLNVPTVVYEMPHFQSHCMAGTQHLHQISTSVDHHPNSQLTAFEERPEISTSVDRHPNAQLTQSQLTAFEERPEISTPVDCLPNAQLTQSQLTAFEERPEISTPVDCLPNAQLTQSQLTAFEERPEIFTPVDIIGHDDTPLLSLMDVEWSPNALDTSDCAVKCPVLRVEVFLAGKLVLKELIDDEGARLFCGDLPNRVEVINSGEHQHVYGPTSLNQICIPDIDKIAEACAIDEYKKQLIRTIQKHMKRGLILRGTGIDISTERLCKSRVYVLTQEGTPMLLKRTHSSSEFVFDSKLFKDHVQRAISGGGCLPSPSITFTFGTKYAIDPISQKSTLFSAKVTHIEAEMWLKQELSKISETQEVLFSSSDINDILSEMFDDLQPFGQ